ncbi:hypothetical protein B0T17DRAFT_244726 [Bombardia bombarda]|uniref:Uncharacterized protein n=1 Tax=Bombardia bombarda TaxID=252184 RepID=A0AA39WZP0_9PEZI|nr:hypothetical protein B0T17DRAFT_244726 [Bombardia bombarda]
MYEYGSRRRNVGRSRRRTEEKDAAIRRRQIPDIESDVDSDGDLSDDDDDKSTTTTGTTAPTSTSSARVLTTLTAISHAPTFPTSTPNVVSQISGSFITSTTRADDNDKDTKTKEEKTKESKTKNHTKTADNKLEVVLPTTTPTASSRTSSSSGGFPAVTSPPATEGSASGADSGLDSVIPVSSDGGGLTPGAKAGIAIGTIASVALIAALLFFVWKRYRARHRPDESTQFGSGGGGGGAQTSGAAAVAGGGGDVRTQSQIMDELMAASYAHQNGGAAPPAMSIAPIPDGYLQNEKGPDGSYPVTIIQPAPLRQPELRFSIASWLRRHHPLKLNPMSGQSSIYSVSSHRSSASGLVANASGISRGSMSDDMIPPLPPVPAAHYQRSDVMAQVQAQNAAAMDGGLKPPKAMFHQSVWSDSTRDSVRDSTATDSRMTTVSEGNTMSILGMYGQETDSIYQYQYQQQPRRSSGFPQRASSSILGPERL